MKNKKIQKMLATVVAATLTVGCLTACGNEPANNTGSEITETSQTDAKQETVVSEEKKEPVEITYVMYDHGDEVFDDMQAVEDAVNEYIEPLIGVTVDVKKSEELGGDLAMALAAGEDIDLFWVSNAKFGPELMVNDGAYDVTDIIKEYPDIYNLIPESVWTASAYQGRNYYIPIPKEFATGMSRMIAAEFVKKYGWDFSTVKELKDLEPMLAQLYADGIDYPYLNHTHTYTLYGLDDFAFIKDYAGVARNGDTTKIISIFETNEYKEYVDLKYSWNQAGYINQAEIEQLKSATINELKNTNEVGFISWNNVPDGKNNATSRNPYEMDIAQLTENYIDTGCAFGSAYMINSAADSETVEACLKFLNTLFTDEKVANLLTYGIEGKHYELVDGRISILADTKYKTSGLWTVTAYNATTLAVGESENKEALYKEFNEAGILSCTAGFSFDQTKVEAEIAACDAVVKEYRILLEKGFYNPDEYLPIMVDALKKAGLETVIAEIQTQYDAWLASK
ncbi:MAG: ABC transporter substrate-binding protein [Lachnospiraceae bacterium]|nr:ABC transporter substrate-binding protein [Lachnospiraceae bacterium]